MLKLANTAKRGLTSYRAFTSLSSNSGKDYFDYEFERKLDRGTYPHEHINFTKVLDAELDTRSEEYLTNYDAM